MIWRPAVTLVNARVVTPGGERGSFRFTTRVLGIDEPPRRGDVVVDAAGAVIFPGLINAHDHLELNHYGCLTFRSRYINVSEWIDDMRPRIAYDAAIREGRSRPLSDRLFVGGLKNLLSGVTTVAHHNPFYRELRRGMPVRVLKQYGWAHSFDLQDRPVGAKGESGGIVQERFRATASQLPFVVHVAEGIDARACCELARLQAEGCLAANTVIVHGLAIDAEGWRRVAAAGASVVWCPASNVRLFGETIDFTRIRSARARPRIALGTDSRLTGSRDLLDELRVAAESPDVPRSELLSMVTTSAADAIRQPQLGRIAVGAPADFLVVPAAGGEPIEALLATGRREIGLVVVGGRPMVGAEAFASVFAARGTGAPGRLLVDGIGKLADPLMTQRIGSCAVAEPGVAVA